MTHGRILVIDDDHQMRVSLAHLLESAKYDALVVASAQEALDAISTFVPDAIISDVRMPNMDGLEFQLQARDLSRAPVILISAHGDIPMAVNALQNGAYSFVEKPFDPRRLLSILKNAIRFKRLQDSTIVLQDRLAELSDIERILIGNCDQIKLVRDLIFDFAISKANVLIIGDTGTGKELVARALHDLGSTAAAPFVAINCAAIPPERFEEVVFGTTDKPHGLMQQADGGTLFLDELGSMPIETQAKILRTIETKQFQRNGETELHSVQFRVISATTPQIEQSVADKTFRTDLLFRLNTLSIDLPPLAARGEDVLFLAQHYMQHLSQLYGLPTPDLTNEDIAVLMSHKWPGNVRELQSVAERFVLTGQRGGGSIRLAIAKQTSQQPFPTTLREAVAAFEREVIGRAIQQEDGRMDEAAAFLGIGRRTLNEKVVKLGLDKQALLSGNV